MYIIILLLNMLYFFLLLIEAPVILEYSVICVSVLISCHAQTTIMLATLLIAVND